MAEALPHPAFCACCSAPSPRTPAQIANRPGLSRIAFRIGTFATFREAMLEAIAAEPALATLTTRESDDYAITVLELFAAVGDVLSFYNERIANELFLRTANERDSLLRLVRLIGYQLRPGLAATGLLAFSLDAGAETRIRRGLKVMSVPGQDERPQIFETLEQITAHGDLNRLAVFAPPVPFNAFAQGQASAPLAACPEPLTQGDSIIFYGTGTIEEKKVDKRELLAGGERLSFSPPVQAAGWTPATASAEKVERRLRFFGHNLSNVYQHFEANPAIAPDKRWTTKTDPTTFEAGLQAYPLDARYDDLRPGARLLIDAGPSAAPRFRLRTVAATHEEHAFFGGVSATVTHVKFNADLGEVADRRQARIYQLAQRDIGFRSFDYPASLTGGRVAVRFGPGQTDKSLGGLAQLAKGRRILLESGAAKHVATVTAAAPYASTPGTAASLFAGAMAAVADHLVVDFMPPLPQAFGDTLLRGNVAQASHGETQPDETLGNGDAAKTFQKFRLARAPLTYLPTSTSLAGEAELQVRVNGELWKEVPSLYGRRATERVYTARRTDSGDTVLTFGDGRTGARIPTGAMNVVARYRRGIGLEGRVKADQLSTPLERPVGLRAVTNPFAADGAAEPETRDDARGAAPTTVRTFGRIVSLRDFEWLATSSGLVSRAYVTWIWHELQRAVHLTVAAAGGASLSPTALATLYRALTSARDPNRRLFLANLVRVPIVVKARILPDPAFEPDKVLENARAALQALFAFETVPLGAAVHASHVFAAAQSAAGVRAVALDTFHLKGFAALIAVERDIRDVTSDPIQQHIRIFPARPKPDDAAKIDHYVKAAFDGVKLPSVLPAEQAFIAQPATDLDLTLVEAL
ncbi:MAG TPA: hypothetical protein VF601_23545 [Beijerinckiaceae bacterium]|jgi:hypothetical protein